MVAGNVSNFLKTFELTVDNFCRHFVFGDDQVVGDGGQLLLRVVSHLERVFGSNLNKKYFFLSLVST